MKFVLRYLILWHRWLGIVACLLFMLWFVTGLVLHFVHFPELNAEEKYNGLAPIDIQSVKLSLYDATHALPQFDRITKARLIMSANRPMYIVTDDAHITAIYADTGKVLRTLSTDTALEIANLHATQRELDHANIAYASLEDVDQWTVSNDLDAYRPLHRITLNNKQKTELYVSDVTGEVVRDTNKLERGWNYVGSIIHWIYPTFLRKHWAVWNWLVWTVSFIALVAALSGIYLGLMRLRWRHEKSISPYRGMHYLHHMGGIFISAFLLTYIFSGWLSMDHGLLFSNSSVSAMQRKVLAGGEIHWDQFNTVDLSLAQGAKQLDWVQLAGKPYVIATFHHAAQKILGQHGVASHFAYTQFKSEYIQLLDGSSCALPTAVANNDAYASNHASTPLSSTPLLRVVCNDKENTWFHIDSGNAQIVEVLNDSKRLYRWLYTGLHTLDFPALNQSPQLKTILVILFTVTGFIFSLTGVILSWRRLRQ